MSDNPSPVLPGIEHIVVLMLENRSFDNVLGWLYDPANAPPFDKVPDGQIFEGLSGKGLTNPWTGHANVPAGSTTDTTNPNPDPGEEYEKVYQQLYNIDPHLDPIPPDPPQPPPMTGFVNNYVAEHPNIDPSRVMNGFRPAQLPIISRLANAFVVCDHWFAPVPSQTLTNRSFMHAGTSSGYVNNKLGEMPIFINDTDTIYDLLENQQFDWRIYHGGHWFLCNALLTQGRLEQYIAGCLIEESTRIQPLQNLFDAAAIGNLPNYAFVEPNFLASIVHGPETDMHPEAGLIDLPDLPSDAKYGDKLVGRIYDALKNGPQWDSTLFIVTFDEHGGCYDHVPPGSAEPPDDRIVADGELGYSGFKFNRYGVRVPALMISPRLRRGAVDHTIYDHTSILRTVMDKFSLQGDLGNRTATANPLAPPMVEPRPASDMPEVPEALTDNPVVTQDAPLSGMRRSMVHAAIDRMHAQLPAGTANKPEATSKLQAESALQSLVELVRHLPKL